MKKYALVVLIIVLGVFGINKVQADGLPWELHGPERFNIVDNEGYTGSGSDLYVNQIGENPVKIYLSENMNPICLLSEDYIATFPANINIQFTTNYQGDVFRVVDQQYLLSLSKDTKDGGLSIFEMCWPDYQEEDFQIFLPMISN